jgi:hypothetical protein
MPGGVGGKAREGHPIPIKGSDLGGMGLLREGEANPQGSSQQRSHVHKNE